MSKRPIILDPDRSAQSDQDSIVEWIKSTTVQLPNLSPMALQSLAFDHYDKSIQPGEPTAAKIAAGIMNLPELDQKTAAARRSEWSRSRCCEWLRFEAARLNKELVEIAEKTKSEAVKAAVIDAIYGAIICGYPHLKAEAADMAVKRKLELAKNGKNGAAISKPEPSAPAVVTEARATTLVKAKQDAADDAEGDLNQIGNAQLAALRLVHQYVIPAAAVDGITIDAQQANALVMNALIQSFYQRSHHKFSRTRIKVLK
jgi:hypothetical protein